MYLVMEQIFLKDKHGHFLKESIPGVQLFKYFENLKNKKSEVSGSNSNDKTMSLDDTVQYNHNMSDYLDTDCQRAKVFNKQS